MNLKSKRFWVASVVFFILMVAWYLTREQVLLVLATGDVIAYILGDSYRPTENK